jgi:hypothetical protein
LKIVVFPDAGRPMMTVSMPAPAERPPGAVPCVVGRGAV